MLLYFAEMNCGEPFGFRPRPGDFSGCVCTTGANRGSQCVFLPLFSHMNYIFNWGKGLSCHVGLFLCTNPKGCCFRNYLSGFLLQMSALLIRGFFTFGCRKTHSETSQFCCCSQFFPPVAVLPLFLVLNLKICLQPVYINVKIIIFWEKNKKKRISFSPPSCDKCRICVEVYRSE